MPIRLHINIDHVATVRNARGTPTPDPVLAAQLCELAGADGITAHLREDRRHIRDTDIERLRATISTHLNLECAATEEMRAITERIVPDTVTLVPERREERTTEGGLDVMGQRDVLAKFIEVAQRKAVRVSLFIGPDEKTVRVARELGVEQVELHTGEYCHLHGPHQVKQREAELTRLKNAAALAHSLGLEVAAGHGLNRHNVGPVVAIPEIREVDIGHSVIGDAIFMGLSEAVKELRLAIERAAPNR